ncbi:sensor histidine kinase [Streptomyces sp. BI20]|uniref:sensor histidine kinase n=1 Tax=Streptomyces sp. BI20 TaxID=3403460 RepID=UPI003C76FA69
MTDTIRSIRIATPPHPAADGSPVENPVVPLWNSFRDNLLNEPFARVPLAPSPADGPFVRRLPEGIRQAARHTRHALVMGLSAILFIAALASHLPSYGLVPALFLAVLTAGPLVVTLTRPVGAFWILMGASVLLAGTDAGRPAWPWAMAAFPVTLAVLAVVALRTRPSTALWMWVVNSGFGVGAWLLSGFFQPHAGVLAMIPVSAFLLLLICVQQVRRGAAREVSAEREVTAAERGMRTLLEERTTIARELHDVVAHHMSVVAIQAEAAPYRVENPPPELEAAFATIRENAVAALTELRRVLGVVRTADFEAPDAPQPTLADLDSLIANVHGAGIRVTKTLTGGRRPLPQGVELSAYRIVQEALSNVLRHAPGAEANVEISYVLGGLGLRVVNERPSKEVRPSPGAGHGLTGMRERVAMLHGEITTGPTAEGGYEVSVFVPAPRAEAVEGLTKPGAEA